MPATVAWGHGGCMMKFRENEDAVSPVIGVILMVAITVILAAVIAAFVFGMTGNVQTTKTVSMGSKLDAGSIVLTVNGGPDLSTLQQITVTIDGNADIIGNFTVNNGASTDVTGSEALVKQKFSVGDTIKLSPDGDEPLTGRLLVVGKWSDGAEQIIIDRTY